MSQISKTPNRYGNSVLSVLTVGPIYSERNTIMRHQILKICIVLALVFFVGGCVSLKGALEACYDSSVIKSLLGTTDGDTADMVLNKECLHFNFGGGALVEPLPTNNQQSQLHRSDTLQSTRPALFQPGRLGPATHGYLYRNRA